MQELTTELKALRPEELTARIRAHIASDWRRNPDGTFDIKANRLKAEFERHAKDLNVQFLKEYERLSYEVIKNPEHVFIQRTFNPQTKKFETNYIFVRNGIYVISNDETLAIQTCGRLKKDLESWLSELSENSQSAIVKLLGGRTTPAQPRKLEDLIDKYDFRSIQDVERMLKDFAEKPQDLLRHRVKDSKVKKNVNYIMGVISKDGENATFLINKSFEKALLSALQNFKNKVPLSKEDEKILQSLWHEITHLRTKDIFKFFGRLSKTEQDLLETVTDFIARHTYKEFFEMLRPTAKPKYQKEVIEEGLGYQTFVRRFRYVLQKFEINEKEAVKELESILFEDGKNLRRRLMYWLKTKADLLAFESDDIINNIVNQKISDEKFQKEVEEYYERRKKRRLSS